MAGEANLIFTNFVALNFLHDTINDGFWQGITTAANQKNYC